MSNGINSSTIPRSQEQLKKLSNAKKKEGQENAPTKAHQQNGNNIEQKENIQNGNGNRLEASLHQRITNSETAVGDSCLADQKGKSSPEGGGEGGKNTDTVRRISELVARNPLYTSLHRL
jgi:hypothetical protein